MTDAKLTELRSTSPYVAPLADTDLMYLVQDVGSAPDERVMSGAELKLAAKKGITWMERRFVTNPQAVYAQRAQIVLFRTDAAITITRIHIHGSDPTPTTELAGDLKWADDVSTGGFANAAVIDICDTTNGVVTITSSFDDTTIASGKYVYFHMDSSPHADWTVFYIEVYYTYD
jgi:hypothetical protein